MQLRQRLGIGPVAPAPSGPPAPVTPPAASPASAARALPSPPRFALQLGPFLMLAEAERVERQLTLAGVPTTRLRQQTGAGLYGVLVERLPAGRDAQALATTLREQGFAQVAVLRADPPALRLGEPQPLRATVELAERARALGHPVRVAAEPGEAVAYLIRHGTFATRPEAEAKSAELGRLGLSHQVVQVR
jgi:cell division protein FtsN